MNISNVTGAVPASDLKEHATLAPTYVQDCTIIQSHCGFQLETPTHNHKLVFARTLENQQHSTNYIHRLLVTTSCLPHRAPPTDWDCSNTKKCIQ